MPAGMHVDWFRLLVELKRHGFSLRMIGEQVGIPESTMRGYSAGSEPSHVAGEALVVFWCQVTSKSRDQLPIEPMHVSAARAKN